jgi:hypothetical protein
MWLGGTTDSKPKRKQTMPREKSDVVWVVVLVESGIPDCKVYRDQKPARAQEKVWRKAMTPDDDQVSILVKVGAKSSS